MSIFKKKSILKVFLLFLYIVKLSYSIDVYAEVNELSLMDSKLNGLLSVIYSDEFDIKNGKVTGNSINYYIEKNGKYFTLNVDNAEVSEYLHDLVGKNVEVTILDNSYKNYINSIKINNISKNSLDVSRIEVFDNKHREQSNFIQRMLPAQVMKKPWLNILCKFSNNITEPVDTVFVQNMFRNSFPFLEHYWKQVTFGNIDISGTQTVGWFILPKARNYYVVGESVKFAELARDCKAVAGSSFNSDIYAGTNLYFNDDLGGPATGGFLEGNRITWLPPWSHKMISVVAHEMGHTYGLRHSSGEYSSEYDSPWDMMSNTYTNPGSIAPYKFIPQHMIAFHKYKLGVLSPSYIWSNTDHDASKGVVVHINQLETKPTEANSYSILNIYSSSGAHYTVEARNLIDYDEGVPANAVILHKIINNYRAYVVDPDKDGDPGDESAQWTVGETFKNDNGDVEVEILSKTSTGFNVKVTAPFSTPIPIYRLYNTKTGAQLYTRGVEDRDKILMKYPDFEYTDSVPAFYASLTDDGSMPIYRLYNTKSHTHLYTIGTVDRDKILEKYSVFEFTDGEPAFYLRTTLN